MPTETIERGVWPAMITPFKSDLSIDFDGLSRLVEFYIKGGVAGLLGTCWSSETEFLTFEESLAINRHVVKVAGGRVPVAATPHAMADGKEISIEERVERLFETGLDYVVMVAARLIGKDQPESLLCERVEKMPWNNLGIYESPSPYHRLLSPEAMKRLADTGRCRFHKDTSCNIESIKAKIAAVKGTPLRFYNAHSPTLLDSLLAGGNGYCGVGANFYPEVYAEICNCVDHDLDKARKIQDFLNTVEKMSGNDTYPANAKLYLKNLGLGINTATRMPRTVTDEAAKLLGELSKCYETQFKCLCSS